MLCSFVKHAGSGKARKKCRGKHETQETFLVKVKVKVKVASPEESARIVTHENIYFSNGNYERRSSKLADENAKC